jgi:hypothetical protein
MTQPQPICSAILRDRTLLQTALIAEPTPLATCNAVEALRRQRRNQAAIASELGLSPATVSRILRRRGLKPVPMRCGALCRTERNVERRATGWEAARRSCRELEYVASSTTFGGSDRAGETIRTVQARIVGSRSAGGGFVSTLGLNSEAAWPCKRVQFGDRYALARKIWHGSAFACC